MTKNLRPINKKDNFSLQTIQDRLHNLFDDFFGDIPVVNGMTLMRQFPCINVSEHDNNVIIKAELPNVQKEDIKIDIDKNRVIISGEKKDETDQKNTTYHLYEISYGKFQRSISLNFDVHPDKIHASFSDGVLKIEIEKPIDQMPAQTIPIK